jgi:type II secretory pathway component HofQ
VSPPAAPKPADRVASPPAPDIAVLALERRLVEERAARERLTNELAEARRQLETLASHQASAVERSRDVVRLEGALAAALARAEAAERHAGELTQPQAPIVVEPLARRVPRRQGGSQDWSAGARAGAVVVLVVLFVAFVLILSTLL